MSVNRRFVDRRGRPRFEIVGDLWGTLEITASVPIVNLGTGGALVASEAPWEVGSVHSVIVANGERVGRAKVCVRHVTGPARGSDQFLIGIEFLAMSPELAAIVDGWLQATESKGDGERTVL